MTQYLRKCGKPNGNLVQATTIKFMKRLFAHAVLFFFYILVLPFDSVWFYTVSVTILHTARLP